MYPAACRPIKLRSICLYLLTTILLTTIMYVALTSHTRTVNKVDILETDVKHLLKEVGILGREIFNSHERPNRALGGTEDVIEKLISKQVECMKKEFAQTKQNVDAMLGQFEKRAISSQIAGEIARTDYALESLGGQIVHVQDTPYIRTNYFLTFLGLAPVQNEPRNVLRPSLAPGDCYAFQGTKSTITIRLMANIFIDSVTVQHIPEAMSPSGNIKSAPKDFSGLKTRDDLKPFFFGSFSYDATVRKSVQIFVFTQESKESYRFIQFRFTSNNGQSNFTCIYRLSVHGKMDTNKTNTGDPHTLI